MEQIAVILQNLENATSYSSKFYVFDENGGDIGSDSGVNFYCQDTNGSIQAKHARINYEEGFFAISPYNNCEIFYNDSFSKLSNDYETVINKGDVFKIGDLKLMFVEPSKIDEYIGQSQKLIENTPNFDKLDNIHLEPRGKILNPDFKEKSNINLSPREAEKIINNTEPEFINPITQETLKKNMLTSENMENLIQKIIKNLQTNDKPASIRTNSEVLNVKDLEAIISTIPLSNSTTLINTVLVKLICKELYSHMYDIIENNSFFRYFSEIVIKSTQEDKKAFEYLVLKALESYNSKN